MRLTMRIGRLRRRTSADLIRERIAHKRAFMGINRPRYRAKPFSTPSILGSHRIEFTSLTVFSSAGRHGFYTALRQIIEVPDTAKIILDFSRLKEIKISAVVILYAHLEGLLHANRRARVLWRKPEDSGVSSALAALGLWALLGESYKSQPGALRICSVSHREKELGNPKPLREAITYAKDAIASSASGEQIDENDVTFGAISESFTNVWQHAYKDPLAPRHKTIHASFKVKKWWIAVQRIDDQLFMAVYDVGVGIPASTRKKKWYTSLAGELTSVLTGMSQDCRDIKTAMAYGVSRFKEQGRGNGLPTMKKFVEINPDGILHIMSGKGIYQYRSRNNSEKLENIESTFPGALIQWNIALANSGKKQDD